MDIDVFPGLAEMAWLKANTNLAWCGYYLGPAPSHDGGDWMGQLAALQAQGWGVAPVYVGQQLTGPGSHVVTAAQGTIDGGDAANLMTQEGFAAGSTVYLDLEDGPPFTSPRTDYVSAWVAAVAAQGWQPGIYCSHAIAAGVVALCPGVRIWGVKVRTTTQHPVPGTAFPDSDPGGCGYAPAFMWQLDQNCRLTLPGAPQVNPVVDLNSALSADPSAP
jgi:hypothetical protein